MVCTWTNRCCQQLVAKGLPLARHGPQCLQRIKAARRQRQERKVLATEQIGLHEDAPLKGAEALRLPPTSSWSGACARAGRLTSRPPTIPWLATLAALATAGSSSTSAGAMLAIAQRVEEDLSTRHVLCDRTFPCTVNFTTRAASGPRAHAELRICLPTAKSVRRARTCEAYGELWQQIGGALVDEGLDDATAADTSDGGESGGCTTIDVGQLVIWWRALRRGSPFIMAADEPRLAKLIWTKPLPPVTPSLLAPSAAHAKTGLEAKRAHLFSAYNAKPHETESPSPDVIRMKVGGRKLGGKKGGNYVGPQARAAQAAFATRRSFTSRYNRFFQRLFATTQQHQPPPASPQSKRPFEKTFKKCAVVGSGHDLRCGDAKGAEIDAHDAVFRANGAQAVLLIAART